MINRININNSISIKEDDMPDEVKNIYIITSFSINEKFKSILNTSSCIWNKYDEELLIYYKPFYDKLGAI